MVLLLCLAALAGVAAGCGSSGDEVKTDVENAATDARDAVTSAGDDARDAVTSAADDARDAVTDAADDVRTAADDADLPDVDWDRYGENVRDQINDMADKGDCEGLRTRLTTVEADDTDLTEYIKAKAARVPCSIG